MARASFYGEDIATNNRAEVTALRECMEWLAEHATGDTPPVVVLGDSQLVVDFCNRRARPSVGDLYEAMQRVHALRKVLPCRVFFRHVPRERNQLADWLTNVARAHKASGDCLDALEGVGPQDPPPRDPAEVEWDCGLVAPVQPLSRMQKKRRR